MVEMGASDLHLTTQSPPMVRLDGKLIPLPYPALTVPETKQLAYSVLTDAQKHRFEENLELDFSFGVKGLARFRANNFMQRGAVGGVYRQIPYEILGFKELGLPPVVELLCDKPRGLILVCGPTGSGKTTTQAAMIDKINREKQLHIVTIEDPIEFLHGHKKCLVNQRELHADTHSFSNALRAVLREDPDVVLIGEMRDLETIEAALRIAETGHFTLATLHTNSATTSINRIIDVFPAGQQSQIRTQLSFVLEGIMCQTLHRALERQGPRHGSRGPGAQRRRPQPDPRGQDPPDLLDDAVRTVQVRHADVQPVARDPVPEEADHASRRRSPARRCPTSCRSSSTAASGSTSRPRPRRPGRGNAMPNYVWKGRNRTGIVQEGVLVADTKEVALTTLRRQNIVVTGIRERGKEISLTKMGPKGSGQDPGGLHPSVLGHDRRGSPPRAVPRDPREPAGAQEFRQDPAAGAPGRRGRLDARRRHAAPPEGLRRSLREHGRGRGGRRYSRHDPPAPLDLHREGRQAARAGPGGADLPDRRHLHRGHRRRGHPAEGHPDVRRPVHEPRRRAPLPDARRDLRPRTSARPLLHLRRHRSSPRASSSSGATTRPTAGAASSTERC